MDIGNANTGDRRSPPTRSSADAAHDVLCRAVARLYETTLDLTSVASQTEPELAARIMASVVEVDDAIRQLRHDLIGHLDTPMVESVATARRFV